MLGHTNPVSALIQLKWSKNEYTVISSSYSSSMVFFTKGEIKTWNALNGTCLSTINGHSDIISCIKGIKWSFDDSTIMTGSYDYLIKIWDIKNGICINTLKEHTEPVICIIQMKWDKNDMTIVSGSMDNTIKIWEIFSTSDSNSSNSLMTLKGHTSFVLCLKQIKNLKNEYTILSGSKDTTVKVWNLDGYVCIKTLKAHQSYVDNILQIKSKRNEGNLLITTGKKELKMWIF
jgi:WD40 repeat protein